jgi:hypothetical protein
LDIKVSLYLCPMRSLHALLLGSLLLAQTGQRVKAAFGLIEGNSTQGGGFYSLIREPSGAQTIMLGSLIYNGRSFEPYGNDLAYDPRTKHLFLTGGGPGVIYGMDVWRSELLDSLTGPIGARRLAVKDTLLLVTRNQAPFFTAYRIRPTATGVALDSLWSPSSAYLRNVPEAIIVVGDTAFISLTYDPNTYAPDSLILSINLRTQQVDSFAKVYPNPAELVRIGGKLHAACYGDYSVPLHISEVDIPSRTVTITNTGVNGSGGFVTDTGGRDTILFVDVANALRAYSTATRQVAPAPYQGIQAIGSLKLYGLLWAGDWLITGHTNHTDTLIVTFNERGRPASLFDTIGSRIPSLRRLIYVEEDATVLELARANQIPAPVQVYPNPVSDRFWLSGEGIQQVTLSDLYGRVLYTWEAHTAEYALPNLPKGLYLLQVQTSRGPHTLRLQKL